MVLVKGWPGPHSNQNSGISQKRGRRRIKLKQRLETRKRRHPRLKKKQNFEEFETLVVSEQYE
jgi:hypothetical protein